MKRILYYLLPYKKRLLLGFSIKVTGTVAELFIPFLMTHILENVIVTEQLSQVVYYGVIMLVCAAIACIGNVTANRMAARVTADFSIRMRKDLFSHTRYPPSRDRIPDREVPFRCRMHRPSKSHPGS